MAKRTRRISVKDIIAFLPCIDSRLKVEPSTDGKVSSLIISDSVATGVKLENGVEYSAKTIVSSISPVNTFLDLVGAQNLETDLIRRIRALRYSGNTSKLNIIYFTNQIT